MAAVWGIRFAQANEPGVIVCGREFMNSLDESSMAEVKAAIASEPWLAASYDVGEKYIRTKDKRIEFAFHRAAAQSRQHQIQGADPAAMG
jgi:phage terminase large subunit